MYLFYMLFYILSLGVVCIVFCLTSINHYRLFSLKNIAEWKRMMSQVLLTHQASQGNLIFQQWCIQVHGQNNFAAALV